MRLHLPHGLVRLGAAPAVRALAATWRVRFRRREIWEDLLAGSGPRLVLLWHEVLLPLLLVHRDSGITIVVSEAREGRYLTDFAGGLGYQTIGGSSHRGAVKAMRGAMQALAVGALLAVTPDGPRGPRRVIKPGTLAAAQATGATVMTVHATARPGVRLRSWDRFVIPGPFARIRIAYGPTFRVDPGDAGVESAAARCAADLAALEEEITWHDVAPPIA